MKNEKSVVQHAIAVKQFAERMDDDNQMKASLLALTEFVEQALYEMILKNQANFGDVGPNLSDEPASK